MVGTVMGIIKKPYRLDTGASGISCRVSFSLGVYVADPSNNEYAVGSRFIEVKVPLKIADQMELNQDYYIDLDDKGLRLKSAMIQTSDGFIPLE